MKKEKIWKPSCHHKGGRDSSSASPGTGVLGSRCTEMPGGLHTGGGTTADLETHLASAPELASGLVPELVQELALSQAVVQSF